MDSFIWFNLAASERAGAMMYFEAPGKVLLKVREAREQGVSVRS